MLTQYDIAMMQDSVMDILKSWGTVATILVPKPENQQPNWNPIMREYTGKVWYDRLEDVPVERLEVVNEYHSNVSQMKAGTKVESSILYKFPVRFNGEPLKIKTDMILMFNGNTTDKYKINTIRERIGETVVDVDLIVGGTDTGW